LAAYFTRVRGRVFGRRLFEPESRERSCAKAHDRRRLDGEIDDGGRRRMTRASVEDQIDGISDCSVDRIDVVQRIRARRNDERRREYRFA
jgi:hypothetical protein